eukprot:s3881_g4.t1
MTNDIHKSQVGKRMGLRPPPQTLGAIEEIVTHRHTEYSGVIKFEVELFELRNGKFFRRVAERYSGQPMTCLPSREKGNLPQKPTMSDACTDRRPLPDHEVDPARSQCNNSALLRASFPQPLSRACAQLCGHRRSRFSGALPSFVAMLCGEGGKQGDPFVRRLRQCDGEAICLAYGGAGRCGLAGASQHAAFFGAARLPLASQSHRRLSRLYTRYMRGCVSMLSRRVEGIRGCEIEGFVPMGCSHV